MIKIKIWTSLIAYIAGALIALPFAIMAGAVADWHFTCRKICDNLLEEIEEEIEKGKK